MRGRGWRAAGWKAAAWGAASALALPPLHLLPVLWLAVPGLLALIDEAPGPRAAFARGFWFSFALNLLGLYWITEAILVEVKDYWWLVPFAVPVLSLVLTPFIAVPCALARLLPRGLPRVLGLAGLWVGGDLARQFVLTGFPWNLWGADWTIPGRLGDVFLQPAAWVGVHGLTLMTLLVAAAPRFGRRGWAAAAAGLALWAGLGVWRLSGPAPQPPGIAVVIVQGDVSELARWNRAWAVRIFRRYLRLTRQGVAAAGNADKVVIWPETASPFLLAQDAAARRAVADAAGPGVPVLAGTVRFARDGSARNSLVAIEGPGPVVAVYDKWHLVPFGEYTPQWLPLPVQFGPGSFRPGPGPRTLTVPGLPPFGPLICYEAIFTGEIVARPRPRWLVNITNDAWFGNSTGPRQHLAAARLRAVEEGLPLVRAANSGISAVFDAYGRETGRLGLGRRGVLIRPLPGALPATFYARHGLLVPAILALLSVGLGTILGASSRRLYQNR